MVFKPREEIKIAKPLLLCFVLVIAIGLMAINLCGCTNEAVGETVDGKPSEDAFAVAMSPDLDYLIVVNDDNEYVFGGSYDMALLDNLVYASDIYGEPNLVEGGAYLAFNMLQQKLHDEGAEIALFSGYRTKDEQQEVYDYYGSLEGWADTNKVMKPGFSEHHTGLVFNIVIWGVDEEGNATWITETAERQQRYPEFKIVHDYLADYGFIDRYPAGKEDVTGVPCEPYEIRFVGSSSIAHEIMDNGLCLEEYLEKNK